MAVTKGLLEAIERCAESVEGSANRLVYSEEYKKHPEGAVRQILDKAIEQQLQDVAVLRSWVSRQNKEE